MGSETRKFIPEVETVWHKDYQCDYYRGVVIDDNDRIVVRCAELRPDSGQALRDAEKKIALSPLYSRQTTPEMQAKLEEYKRQKAEQDMLQTVAFFDPKERNQWQYLFDATYDGGLYRFRYVNQNAATAIWIAGKSKSVIGGLASVAIDRAGESDKNFYLGRVKCELDIENLPGHKDIWKILEVMDITEKKNRDSRIQIRYVKYNNLSGDWRKGERKTTITIKRKWPFYNELMEYFVFVSRHCSYQCRQASPHEES